MNPKARIDDLVIQEMDKEIVVYDRRTHGVTRLNDVAAFVWRCCDGLHSKSEIAAEVQIRFDMPSPMETVSLALVELGKAGLLHQEEQETSSVTRRKAVLKMGRIATGAVMALPIVTFMLAPTPAMATSGNGNDPGRPIGFGTCDCNAAHPKPGAVGVSPVGTTQTVLTRGNCVNLGFACGKKVCTTSCDYVVITGLLGLTEWSEVSCTTSAC